MNLLQLVRNTVLKTLNKPILLTYATLEGLKNGNSVYYNVDTLLSIRFRSNVRVFIIEFLNRPKAINNIVSIVHFQRFYIFLGPMALLWKNN